jgi:tRNA uridine 5-carbamoylmethylation protein Kti12
MDRLQHWEVGEVKQHAVRLFRGLPGAGKTTAAREWLARMGGGVLLEADQFFTIEGEYRFDPTRVAEAHTWTQQNLIRALDRGARHIAVANTFTQSWELDPYLGIIRAYGQRAGHTIGWKVITVRSHLPLAELAARNVHGVPLETIQRMADRWEDNWAEGNPMPPWERNVLLGRGGAR